MLFLPDPNNEFPNGTLGGTTRIIDQFYGHHLSSTPFVEHEAGFEFVYKGIELFDGGAIVGELRHGINQLRYAAPALIKHEILFQIGGHKDDLRPSFHCKILVTNAPLRVLNENIGVSEIEAADDIDTISHPVNAVVVHSGYNPDFPYYCRDVFSTLSEVLEHADDWADEFVKEGKDISFGDNPVHYLNQLIDGDPYQCFAMGTQFFVVNVAALPDLIGGIRAACDKSFATRSLKLTF